jgi:DNA-binding NarL/FixJ family response regulator
MAKKLMIVDDQALSRHLVRHVAATPQDTVLECVSADEALKAVGTFKPDCVMVGVTQPKPGTFRAIKTIRERHPQVRVVAVSTFHEPELRTAASQAGASGYVTTENLSELFLLAAPERLTPLAVRRTGVRRRKKYYSE